MWILLFAKRFDRFKAVMRAAGVIAFASLLLTFAGARRARAELASTSMRIGRDLLPLSDVLAGATTIALNGEKLTLRYDGSTKSVHDILSAAEEACRAGEVKGNAFDFGILRGGDDDHEGSVLCFARGADSPESLMDQAKRLTKTRDLGSLGKMRYVYAKKERGGSVVLAAVTEGAFRLDAFRSTATEDAPGSDDPALPRPIDSVRIFSGVLEGTPYATRAYRTRASEAEVKRAFTDAMRERGFDAVVVDPEKGSLGHAANAGGIGFLRDGVIVILGTARDRDGSLLVSVGSIGVDPARAARARTSPGAVAR